MALDKIDNTGNYFIQMCSDFWAKCVLAMGGLLIDFHFGDISRPLLSAIFMLILFDFISGVYGAYISKEDIKSSKVFRTAWKFVLYFMVVSAGYFTELIIGTDLLIAKTIMIFLAGTELKSIFENIEKAGYPMPQHLYKQLKEIISKK
jgi:toxin secretion/phage lysis holin